MSDSPHAFGSGIASLVEVRRLLLPLMYESNRLAVYPGGMGAVVDAFRRLTLDADAIGHLDNIQSIFEQFLDVFETRALLCKRVAESALAYVAFCAFCQTFSTEADVRA